MSIAAVGVSIGAVARIACGRSTHRSLWSDSLGSGSLVGDNTDQKQKQTPTKSNTDQKQAINAYLPVLALQSPKIFLTVYALASFAVSWCDHATRAAGLAPFPVD